MELRLSDHVSFQYFAGLLKRMSSLLEMACGWLPAGFCDLRYSRHPQVIGHGRLGQLALVLNLAGTHTEQECMFLLGVCAGAGGWLTL